ncbi:ABC transporter related [Alloalcanivorax xenomutans]|nr:ABC transporter related [Alloalcanivorax xenomutans]
MMSALETRELIIDVPGRVSGRALSLRIEPGQRWGILGPNGAGKTTLLHTLAGLRAPRSGQVLLDGKPLSQWRRRQVAQRLAVVFQERQDGFPATVLETALIGRHPFLPPWRMETAADLERARDALRQLDLSHLEPRLVSTLSGGERQRLALATALAQQPALWLADEPTNHLDLHHQVAVMRLLEQQSQQGAGLCLCLHDLNLAARWCDRVLLLYPDGELCHGPADAMLIPEALEKLYRQRLMVTEINGTRVFLPG